MQAQDVELLLEKLKDRHPQIRREQAFGALVAAALEYTPPNTAGKYASDHLTRISQGEASHPIFSMTLLGLRE